jgi:hypothetical protein
MARVMIGMKLAAFHKNNLVPSYDRIQVVVQAVHDALDYFYNQEKPNPILITDDSRPYVRRDHVMSFIIRAISALSPDWKMSVHKKHAGGNFHYVIVRFEDLNLNLVPLHLLEHVKTPRPSGYRGDMSNFNFAIMQERGLQEEMDFQTYLTIGGEEVELTVSPIVPLDIHDIPFGLFLLYDGTNMQAKPRIAALTPEQDRFIFCDSIEDLKELSEVNDKVAKQRPIAIKKRHKVQLNTAQVADYSQTPNVILKKVNEEKRNDV